MGSIHKRYDTLGNPCYALCISDSTGEAALMLAAGEVEYMVAESLAIQPVLDGPRLYLQFHSHGGGFEGSEKQEGPFGSVEGLVESFVEQFDYKVEDEDDFKQALLELDKELRRAQTRVFQKLLRIGAMPDPFSPEFDAAMKQHTGGLYDDLLGPGRAED